MTPLSFHREFRRGISLVEVVTAIALIALSVGGIISLLVQNMGLGQSIDYTYVATNLARSRIERIKTFARDMGYTALPESAESNTVIDRNGVPTTNGDFKRTTLIDDTYATGITKVTVRVYYKIRNAFTSQPVELVTLIAST